MDPYLEGLLWPDVHQAIASRIRDQLAPRLRPKYVARLTVRVEKDAAPEAEIGVSYPDVGLFRRTHATEPTEQSAGTALGITPAVMTIPAYDVEVRLVSVEVREVGTERLVTAIEIISPVNKRGKGLRQYRRKRDSLRAADVHLLEIDLLRRGRRVVPGSRIPASDYLIALTRSHSGATDLWPLSIRDRLPVVPVPLRKEDQELPLDLTAPIHDLYDAAAYDLSIDYSQPPPPPELSPEDAEWVRRVMRH
jgi:hypothetical protein